MRKRLGIIAVWFCLIFLTTTPVGYTKKVAVAHRVKNSGIKATGKKSHPDRFAEIKRFVKDKYQIRDDSIKYIFALNFDGDSNKVYAVFFEKKSDIIVNELEESNEIINSILEQENGSFRVKYEELVCLDYHLVGIKCRDFDRDGKDELLVKTRGKADPSLKEHDELTLLQFEHEMYGECNGTLAPGVTGVPMSPVEFRILNSLYNSEKYLSPADKKIISEHSWYHGTPTEQFEETKK